MGLFSKLFGGAPWDLHGTVTHAGFTVTIPAGWGGRFKGDLLEFKPPGVKWPNMEVERVGPVRDGSLEHTRQFVHYFTRKRGYRLSYEGETTVAGLPAFEVIYRHSESEGGLQFRRVSVVRDNVEYLIQMCAERVGDHAAVFDACMESFRFS